MAEVLAKAVIQTADGNNIEASAVAIAELAVSENGAIFVEAVAKAILELEDGCVAIAEAISRAEILNGEVVNVIAQSSVQIDCPDVAPTTPAPAPVPAGVTTVECDRFVTNCIIGDECCTSNIVIGETCSSGLITRTYTYSGYCSDNLNLVLLTPSFGFACTCPV
eukprot:TRINITY_DN2977_c0_g2_i1.p2 TRINITY_DN2977_c0_g2~~TRINITY_DN2977_c0_g2_i1.p2  ORF type:complete len:165 (-),score=35.99 TRINITY_DN2977_c0_g2_i1:350-844(-)